MIDWAPLLAAFTLGLVSSAHCVGMCGGIMGALTMAIPPAARQRRLQLLVSYNLGRIGSYTLMGFLMGSFASALAAWGGIGGLRILAGLLLVAMGLYLADWWRGLIHLERAGRYFWVYLQPLGKALLPVSSRPKALLLGVVWGWLPCGLVYSALAYAMAQAQPGWSAAVMFAFGLGTLPAVLATGLLANQLTGFLQQRAIRRGFAVVIIVFGVWTLIGGHHHSGGDHHHSAGEHHHPGAEAPLPLPGVDHTNHH
jgi:sulfite exporter TauE/SafE